VVLPLHTSTTIDEGDLADLSGDIVDPSSKTDYTLTVDWGDGPNGTADIVTYTLAPNTQHFDVAHPYAAPGAYDVTVSVMDQYGEPNPPTIGNQAEATATVNVDVMNPVLETLTVQPPSIFEQQTVIVSGTYTDPGTVDANVVTIDWGDGTSSRSDQLGSTIVINQLNHTFSATHLYAEPAPMPDSTYLITAQVFADYPANAGEHFGGATAPSTPLTVPIVVTDAPPIILTFYATDPSQRISTLYNAVYNHVTVLQPGFGVYRSTFTLSPGDDLMLAGSFSDVGPKDAPFTVSIDWGQGTITLATVTSDASDPDVYDFTGTLASPYQNDGDYIVSVTVTNSFDSSATVLGKFSVGFVVPPAVQPPPDTLAGLPTFASSLPSVHYQPGLTYNPLAGGADFFDALLLSGGGAYGASDTTGSINLLTADQGIEMVLPPAILQNLPRDATQLSFDWGDGTVTSADPATIGDHQPGHVYTQDSGKGTFPLAIIMKGPDGKTTVLHYHVKVFQAAPAFTDTQWGVVSGRNGDQIDITGQLAAAGVDGSYTLSVTWSDGTVTEQTVVNGPHGWTFTIERPAVDGLRPVSITVTDPRNPSNVGTFTFGAPRFGGKTGKQGSLEHYDRSGPAPARFAGATVRDLALVLGASAASVAPRAKGRSDRIIDSGAVMLAGSDGGEMNVGGEGKWLCIDAMLAAKLAGYERANPAAEIRARQLQAWRLPDDWKLAAASSREAQALAQATAQAMAQAMADVIGDNDEWVVRDGNGDLLEAAE
jgi:hypothetical protein